MFGALAAAQSISDLSASCQAVITELQRDNAAATCTDLAGLLNILATPKNDSLIAPIDGWLHSFCGAAPCSNDTISAVAQNITTGCATDLAGVGITASDVSNVASLVDIILPFGKEIACLADSKASEFCVTEVLTSIQTFVGQQLSIGTLENVLPQLIGQAEATESDPLNLPTNVTCTPCVQAAYILAKDAFPGDANITQAKTAITAQCGAAFEQADTMPSGIIEGTGSAVPKPTNGALHRAAAPLSALLAVLAAFAVLA
jgi:hypothetical protein